MVSIANTKQYSTLNEQQLPEIERRDASIFEYQVVISENERKIRIIFPFPTLLDVNVDGVHDFNLRSNQKLSRRKDRILQAGYDNLTFNESYKPVTQQMDNYLKKEVRRPKLSSTV